MKKSESIIEISKALCQSSSELHNVEQTAVNPFFKSKYAPLHDILNYVKPILAKNGLSIVQSGDMITEGHVTVETLLMHTSGEWIETSVVVPGKAKDRYDAQTIGSAITYGRRYSLSAILNISSEEDTDGNDISGHKQSTTSSKLDFNKVSEDIKDLDREKTLQYKTNLEKTFPKVSEKQVHALENIFKGHMKNLGSQEDVVWGKL